ncbi:hypothetical protein NC652_032332 [Populus alba x Populus x berolinensis]|nr:hypothetical protein NC652_032332 [Populus alba x Populus x berolinensis]
MGHGTERAPTTPVNTQPPHCRSVSARRAGKSADTNGCEVFSRIVGNRVCCLRTLHSWVGVLKEISEELIL